MMSEFARLLEVKRVERGETKAVFAAFLHMGQPFYDQILRGGRGIPKKKQEHVAEVLGISIDRLKFLSTLGRTALESDRLVTGDELRYLAGIADAAQAPVRLSLLLQHLENVPKKTT